MTAAADGRTLSRTILLAYGLPGLPLAAVLLPLFVYLPTFYAETLGLGFAVVGSLLLIARLTDVVTDPLVGALSDRFGWPLGRRRSWMILGVPLLLLAAHRLFLPPPDAGGGYLLLWTVLIYLGATLVQLPYSAWGAEISGDYNQRSRISAAREGFVVVGTLLAAGLPALLGSGPQEAMAVIGWVLICVLPIAVGLAVAVVPEGPQHRQRPLAWRQGWPVLYRNRPFRRLLGAYFLNSIANGLPATLFLLYVNHVLESESWSGFLLLVYFACGVAAIPLWLKASAQWGKHRAWIAAMLLATAVFALVPLLGPGDHWWFLAICVVTGIALGADLTLPASMQADVVDLDTLKSGRTRTGIFFALWGIATKLALALAVGIAFPLLEIAGFRAEAPTQTPAALLALALLYSLVPAAFKLGAIALFAGYPITASRQQRIRRLIAARNAKAEGGALP
ncbi:MFS transporter [Pelagibius sp. 7325]|uniref:MFS transporter n=1 Tax=Pelagibius sp. 7325 TaxID=3131994 RepID=UPI0030EB47B6